MLKHTKSKTWKYKNTALLAASIIVLIIFADHAIIRGLIGGINQLGYIGIFFAGLFIVSTFTIVPATLLLSELSGSFGFWETVVLATLGAIIGDFIIFRFIRDNVTEELKPLFKKIAREKHLKYIFNSPFFSWMAPLVGAAIIASPLPDEFGLGLLGSSHLSNKKFILLVTVLDFIGIFLLVSLFKSLAN